MNETTALKVKDVIEYLQAFDGEKAFCIIPVDAESKKVYPPKKLRFIIEEPCAFVEINNCEDIEKWCDEVTEDKDNE